uniref:Uncharacterized protein n=1 Tax=Sciurus vulgaris TaxID=55149 RepID=A0A8D2DTM0_SCIVU
MEDYEELLPGVEDGFHSQFAAELEVLAELEGGLGHAGRDPTGASGRERGGGGRPGGAELAAWAVGRAGSRSEVRSCPARLPRLLSQQRRRSQRPPSAGSSRSRRPSLEGTWPWMPPPGGKNPCHPVFPETVLFLPRSPDKGPRQAVPGTRNPVLRRPPVLEDFINVTSTSGDRAFLVLHADPTGTGVQSPLLDVQWRGRGQLDLLGVSFSSLKEQVDNERHQRLLEEAQRLSDTLHSLRPEEEETPPIEGPEEQPTGVQGTSQHCLWVDEFAPKQYTELLSDDFTNRCLLKWLKLWDVVVFGHERPARKPRPSVEPARIGKEATAPGKWKSHAQVLEEMLEAELDPSHRPRQKVSPIQLCCRPHGAWGCAAEQLLLPPGSVSLRLQVFGSSRGCGCDELKLA